MIAYFDCFAGISGDMTLGAFIDLGVPLPWLKDRFAEIPLEGFDLTATGISRHGISAKQVQVDTTDHVHSRNYQEIRSLIAGSRLPANVKEMSLAIFEKIAAVEAVIHNCPKENVHFHEVGGTDALVDIVGCALCVDFLKIRKVTASRIPLGTGFVSCRHGTLPVPVPATLGILKGVPVYGTEIPHELVTPTGAAIIVTLAESFGKMPDLIVEKVGYGAGKRELDSIPNLLRIITGTVADHSADCCTGRRQDSLVMVETCIDDMNPELFSFLMERLFAQGALDVYWVPVFMKKNRPGTMVQVLCRDDRKEAVIVCILSETTTSGVRFHDVSRCTLAREMIVVDTVYGSLQVKRIIGPEGRVRMVPEYEVCKKIALEKNIPIRIVYDNINRSLQPESG
ncbi:MAG: nickel pincer cofactor biosynthesis protein LarC [Desulfobacterales bacterium]|uniref:Putative nickel insertion protein n=1 Tax=Candidatus Desulfatibia profunda TaxID=2841695 RepID=A0A8J6NUD6_9BACT|nr:nickel pincer cofactor biosynthesis protein LarC [Candidatus Desulfatibia profunda]MBL7181378.1 nickel pincer cofactor biosynthesis protein LarC [Desulfobacterales bacterium]